MIGVAKRREIVELFDKGVQDRRPLDDHFREIALVNQNRRVMFREDTTEKYGRTQTRRNDGIYNGRANKFRNILTSGMQASITPRDKKWFRIQISDPDLNAFRTVRQWTTTCEDILMWVFARSNIYEGFRSLFDDLPLFGVGGALLRKDKKDTIRMYKRKIGSFVLEADNTRRVDTYYELNVWTVRQIVMEFGIENVSRRVADLFSRNEMTEPIRIVHRVGPDRVGETRFPISSHWAEYETEETYNDFLKISGYPETPILAPRWYPDGDDIYGNNCPGMDALGDTRQLQTMEKRKLQILHQITDPATKGPGKLRRRRSATQPGSYTPVDASAQGQNFELLFAQDPRAFFIGNEIKMVEERLAGHYFADLFLAILNSSDSPQKTAMEIASKKEEQMLQLGPVMSSLDKDLLEPAVIRSFNISNRAGMFPDPPPELQDATWAPVFIGLLAQAQKAMDSVPIERFAQFQAGLMDTHPEVRFKFDGMAAMDQMGEALGVNPKLILDSEEARQAFAQQQKAQQAQQAAEMGQTVAGAAKDLSASQLSDGGNALSRLFDQLPQNGPVQ